MQDSSAKLIGKNRVDRSLVRRTLSGMRWPVEGKVTDVVGPLIRAYLPNVQHGCIAEIAVSGRSTPILAEVVGFSDGKALLLSFTELSGISPGMPIRPAQIVQKMPVGEFLLGRIVTPFLEEMDGRPVVIPEGSHHFPIEHPAPKPMGRSRIERPLSLGLRGFDALLTFGEGQRVGLMAGSGVGKSVLMGMIARGSDADVNVICLIGERGREVREFIERELGEEGLRRSVVIVVTSDESPLMKIRAAKVGTTVAEYFSSRGKRVLLMMDSLTRVGMAQREIGLAVGEAPTSKGYPPSVYALLPRILERAGPQAHGRGSISALYTVLVDGDDFNDPMPDTARGILDGHIVLSRDLAVKGFFPAIEYTASVSRVMYDVVTKEHWDAANQLRNLLSVYKENFDYIQLGSYKSGSNPDLDLAIRVMPLINQFLKQGREELTTFQDAMVGLRGILQSRAAYENKRQ
jgi:flagellum-specific ATP synthase